MLIFTIVLPLMNSHFGDLQPFWHVDLKIYSRTEAANFSVRAYASVAMYSFPILQVLKSYFIT